MNSYSVCPLCTPARGSIMTGLYPHQSGIIDNCDVGASTQEYLPKSSITWLDRRQESGRKTGYFGKWHLGLDWQSKETGVEFDICRIESDRLKHETRIPEATVTERGQLKNMQDPRSAKKSDDDYVPFYKKLDSIEKRFEYKVTKKTMEFLEKNRDKPWCVTASLVGPHFPNSNPEPFYIMYDQVDIPMPKSMYDTFQNKPWYQSRKWWPSIDTEYFDEHEWEKTIRAYYGSISLMDYFIGQILEKAKECSGGRKTIVIFTSDHGEMLGNHGKFDKHAYCYEDVIRTPLLVCPDLKGEQEKNVCANNCNTLDIAQTFFELAGCKCKNGRSLFKISEDKKEKKEDIYCNYYKYNGHSFEIRAIKEGNIKYSFIPQDIDELYDLSTDPNEMINLSDDYLCDILDFLPEAGTIGKPEYPALKKNYDNN
ncbi:MAG: sulfatase-like hydrolase/transferase [Anaerobutyricum soehngenii]